MFIPNKSQLYTATRRNQQPMFCSTNCMYKARITKIKVKCTYCKKILNKIKSQVTKNNFCNHSCAAKHANSYKTKGTRRSKLEKWLEERLPILYPNLEFKFNSKTEINSELDIYIPSLKLAFELNGIFHYEPIFGQTKLNQIQNNDHRKFQACAEKEISLCIIDVSKIKYFKESTSIPILDIIQNIINKALVDGYDPS